ncbi:MAG: ABC transporter permease [Erysipelotrichia bacterium]|jgi:oligopeptide transport system permease protein|nr:ABC transporter permease [Bacilli bacterium]NLB49902.1 ABC transporter permease [Erysipelotrichia bacterium]
MSEIKKDLFREFREEETIQIEDAVEQNVSELFKVVGTSPENIEKLDAVPFSYWKITFKALFKKPFVIVSIVMILLVVFFTVFGPLINFYPPVTGHGVNAIQGEKFGSSPYYYGPNSVNWFGVCGINMGGWFAGTDMWSCVWQGARLSLLLGVVVALIDTVLGIIIGAAWGYFRWLDPILIEFRNFVNNIPTLLLDILLMQLLMKYMAQYGFIIIVFLLCALGWLGLASFVRNQIIIIRNREYNIASQTLGSSSWTMISHNFLPYLVSVIVTVVSTAIPSAISAEVGLAYFNLSFRVSDGDITLGQVLTQAVKDNAWMNHPYLLLGPMIVMVPLTIAFFYLGLALSDATDPKTHR